MFEEYSHDDFDVITSLADSGGVEQLVHKDENVRHSQFFRKEVKPDDEEDFNKLLDFQKLIMKDGCYGTIHPMYDHDGKRWAFMSVPVEHYEATGIGSHASSA